MRYYLVFVLINQDIEERQKRRVVLIALWRIVVLIAVRVGSTGARRIRIWRQRRIVILIVIHGSLRSVVGRGRGRKRRPPYCCVSPLTRMIKPKKNFS